MINYDNPVENLPDAYDKSIGSNNSKILKINKDTTNVIENVTNEIFDTQNLNNAKGRVLDDVWGGRLNLERGSLTDEQYKIRLRTKMMQNIADGSFPDLIEALSYTLQCKKSDIRIVESTQPNKIIIKDIPLKLLIQANFTTEQILKLINSLLPVNVVVEDYGFTGTFTYGVTDNEYDDKQGYSDNLNSIGGYYGLTDSVR